METKKVLILHPRCRLNPDIIIGFRDGVINQLNGPSGVILIPFEMDYEIAEVTAVEVKE